MGWDGAGTRTWPLITTNLTWTALAGSETVFDSLPTTAFYAKDNSLRYVMANSAMAELSKATSRLGIIGKSARNFFPEMVRVRHEALDRSVMRAGAPLRDHLELCISPDGARTWLLTTRWPICDEAGVITGVAAILRLLDAERRNHEGYDKLAVVLEHLRENYCAPCDIGELARRVALSPSQLKRDFVAVFGMPPRRYLTRMRLQAALEKLAGEASIVEIAHACGYPDQSAFTRRFRALVGMSPSDYRRTFVPLYACARLDATA